MKNSTKFNLPALFVVGGGLATTLATAIELGEVNVESSLGQPLRASIAYALAPNEQIFAYCVNLKPDFAANGLPAVTLADVSVANGVITLTGNTPIREPLMTARLEIACPYTAKLSREYMLFIDPAQAVQSVQAQPAPAAPSQQPAAATTARTASNTPRTTVRRPPGPPIDASVRYRVQPGDSLSRIAERIENRTINLWSAVSQIFDANPHAFKDHDPNRLMTGRWLVIPDFGQQASFPRSAAQSDSQRETVSEPEIASQPVAQESDGALYPGIAATEVVDAAEPASAPAQLDEILAEEIVADEVFAEEVLVVGDLTTEIADDTAALEPASTPITDIETGDVVSYTPSAASSPNVSVANIITADRPTQPATDWVMWILGGGIALVTGLLAFGLRRRDRGAPAPVTATPQHPMRRRSDGDTEKLEVVPDMVIEYEDDAATVENLILDANLEIGTGLESSTNIDVAQDFGFEVTTNTDLELPEDAAVDEEASPTEIIAPLRIDENSILESEVLPGDDDYDMSVVLDATKMPRNDEATERDLHAVVVDTGDESMISNNYTDIKEVDYDILEQDYEDEMTATQALNREVEKAAAEVLAGMSIKEGPDENTSERPLASVTELEISSKLPAGDDDGSSDADCTGVTEAMVADEKTVEMPAADGDDDTIEMTVEASKIDTKAG